MGLHISPAAHRDLVLPPLFADKVVQFAWHRLPRPRLRASSMQSSRKKVARLNAAGSEFLQEVFISKKVIRPTKDQKRNIMWVLHQIPGCENYSERSLDSWFDRARKKANKDKIENGHIISEQLRILFSSTPFPSPNVIEVWAKLLREPKDDVEAWIREQQRAMMVEQLTLFQTTATSRPEPDSAINMTGLCERFPDHAQSIAANPSLSPLSNTSTLPGLFSAPGQSSPAMSNALGLVSSGSRLPSSSGVDVAEMSDPSPATEAATGTNLSQLYMNIFTEPNSEESIEDALNPQHPINFAQFNSCFEKYEAMIERFLKSQ